MARGETSRLVPGILSMRRPIPDACIGRLSLYARELARLQQRGIEFVSSKRLAEQLRLTDAQVRRDLSYFGQFGTSGRGYEVQRLLTTLGNILGIKGRQWNVALAGAGNLGSALLAYRGFRDRGFLFRVVVDTDPRKVGQVIGGLAVEPAERLALLSRRHQIHIGMIAVPQEAAQRVCDQFIDGGVRAIVNFAPTRLEVPPGVRLRIVDLAVELEGLSFYLARSKDQSGNSNE